MAIHLFNRDTGADLGEVTAGQVDQLGEFLEVEDADDHGYWINAEVVDYMEQEEADVGLIKILRTAIGDSDGVEVEWKEV
jgi:hypothetical protein